MTSAPSLSGSRILVLGPEPPPIGGVTRYCAALAEVLGEQGATVRLGDPDDAAVRVADLVVDNFQRFWRDWRWARREVRREGRRRVIVIHHGGFADVVGASSRTARFFLGRAIGGAGGVLCMGEQIRTAVRRLAPAARTEASAPLLAPIARRVSDDAATRRPPALDPSVRRFVGWSGGYQEHYGISDLIEAGDELVRRHPDVGFVLAFGSFDPDAGVRRAAVRFVERLGAGRVVVLEDAADAPRLMAGASAYVRTSRIDSFCLAIWEARLAGVPVIATKIAGRPPGVVGYDPGDVAGLVDAIGAALDHADEFALDAARLEAERLSRVETERTVRFLESVVLRSARS